MRLGDNRIIPINIRVIAATNKNLEDLVHAGKFRSDLYYRLYVLQLNLPALRERREDIPLLVQGFIRQFQAREGLTTPLELSEADFRLLQDRPWRGNIRELRNFCERLVVLYQPGTSVSDLLAHLLDTSCSPDPEPQVAIPLPGSSHARIDLPYETLRAVLQECRGNRTQAAAKLGHAEEVSVPGLRHCARRLRSGCPASAAAGPAPGMHSPGSCPRRRGVLILRPGGSVRRASAVPAAVRFFSFF